MDDLERQIRELRSAHSTPDDFAWVLQQLLQRVRDLEKEVGALAVRSGF